MASRGPERRISETRLPCPPESGPSASDLRTSNDRVVSSKRDVRVFHKGNFPSSRSFLIYLDRSKLDPFTNVLPRTTLDPPFPVTRVIRLALQVLRKPPRRDALRRGGLMVENCTYGQSYDQCVEST